MLSGVFVGRGAELDLLYSEFEEARSGRPRVVFIAGGAGIGKTALVHQFTEEHHPGGPVLQAGGDEAESDLAARTTGRDGLHGDAARHAAFVHEAARKRERADSPPALAINLDSYAVCCFSSAARCHPNVPPMLCETPAPEITTLE